MTISRWPDSKQRVEHAPIHPAPARLSGAAAHHAALKRAQRAGQRRPRVMTTSAGVAFEATHPAAYRDRCTAAATMGKHEPPRGRCGRCSHYPAYCTCVREEPAPAAAAAEARFKVGEPVVVARDSLSNLNKRAIGRRGVVLSLTGGPCDGRILIEGLGDVECVDGGKGCQWVHPDDLEPAPEAEALRYACGSDVRVGDVVRNAFGSVGEVLALNADGKGERRDGYIQYRAENGGVRCTDQTSGCPLTLLSRAEPAAALEQGGAR